MLRNTTDLPPELRALLEQFRGAPAIGIGLIFGFFVMLVVSTLFGMLGGLFGALMFRKTPPPRGAIRRFRRGVFDAVVAPAAASRRRRYAVAARPCMSDRAIALACLASCRPYRSDPSDLRRIRISRSRVADRVFDAMRGRLQL